MTLEWNTETNAYELPDDERNEVRRVKRTAWKDALTVWMEQDPQTSQDASTSMEMTADASESSLLFDDPRYRHFQSLAPNNNGTITPRPAFVQARICPCSENPHYEESAYYCAADKTYCAVPASYYQHPEAPLCLDLPEKVVFARSIFPVIMIWFCLSLIFCLCTTPGRHAVEYMISTAYPVWNDRIITGWLARQPGRAHELWRRHWDRERFGGPSYFPWRPVGGGGLGGRKVEFVLKTCLYHAPPEANEISTTRQRDENDNDDEDSDNEDDPRATCSICFIRLEEGAKIGKLQCGHLFHSECIKG